MGEMSINQMFMAMKALCPDVQIRMGEGGGFYCRLPSVELKRGGILSGVGGAHCVTPDEAIESAWCSLVDLKEDQFVVVDAMRETRKLYRWNGFMWREFVEPA